MNLFAHPSVNVHEAETLAPVCAPRQQVTRSGFHSGHFGNKAESSAIPRALRISGSTKSGFATAGVKSLDTNIVNLRSQHLAAYSSGVTDTRRNSSGSQLARQLVPQPSRATFRPAVPMAAAAFSPYPSVGLKRIATSQQRKGMKRAMSVSRRAHSCGPDSDESGHPIGSRCVPCATTKRSQTRRGCSLAGGG